MEATGLGAKCVGIIGAMEMITRGAGAGKGGRARGEKRLRVMRGGSLSISLHPRSEEMDQPPCSQHSLRIFLPAAPARVPMIPFPFLSPQYIRPAVPMSCLPSQLFSDCSPALSRRYKYLDEESRCLSMALSPIGTAHLVTIEGDRLAAAVMLRCRRRQTKQTWRR